MRRTLDIRMNNSSPPEVEVLATHDCWRLLGSVSVGRLALWVYDHPDIFPVNYRVDHGTLVFRTGPGTKLSTALSGTPIALETDEVDADAGVAWSVVVKGQAIAVERTQDLLDTVGPVLFPWQTGRRDRFIRIVPESVSGRRFKLAPALTWWSPLDDATRAGLE